MKIRIIKDNEIENVVAMIHKVCKEVFPLYYPQEFIDETINDLSVENEKSYGYPRSFQITKNS